MEQEISRLRRLNIGAGILHTVSFLAILLLSNNFSLPVNATYLTDAQSDARYVPRGAGSTNVRWDAAKGFQFYAPETGKWHTLVAVLVGGVPMPMLAPEGDA